MEAIFGGAVVAIGALWAVAANDIEAYKRLFKFIRRPIAFIGNFSFGVVICAIAIDEKMGSPMQIIEATLWVLLGGLAFWCAAVFILWLKVGAAGYKDI